MPKQTRFFERFGGALKVEVTTDANCTIESCLIENGRGIQEGFLVLLKTDGNAHRVDAMVKRLHPVGVLADVFDSGEIEADAHRPATCDVDELAHLNGREKASASGNFHRDRDPEPFRFETGGIQQPMQEVDGGLIAWESMEVVGSLNRRKHEIQDGCPGL